MDRPGSAPSGSTTGAVAKNAGSTTDVGVCPAVRGISRTPSVHCPSNKASPSCCSAGIGPARPRTRKHRTSQGLQCRIDHGQVGLFCGLWDNLDPSIDLRSGRAGPFFCCSAWIGPARPRTRQHRRSQGLQCRIDHGRGGLFCGLWDNLDPSIDLRSGRAGPFSCCSAWIALAQPGTRQHHTSRVPERRTGHRHAGLSCGPWNQQDSQRPLP